MPAFPDRVSDYSPAYTLWNCIGSDCCCLETRSPNNNTQPTNCTGCRAIIIGLPYSIIVVLSVSVVSELKDCHQPVSLNDCH